MIISRDRYWKRVRKEEQDNNLFLIYLDDVCLKSNQGNNIKLSEKLADEIVREWSVDGKIDVIKNSFFTRFSFSVTDITEKEKETVLARLVNYSECDPVCYIAGEPKKLLLKQKKLYCPIIDWVEEFLSINLNKASGLLHVEQPRLNSGKIRKYLEEFDNFHLMAIHELTKSLGSLFTCLALYKNIVSPEVAWEIANVEDNFRIDVWGKVEEETLIKSLNHDHFKKLVKILQLI